MILGCHSRDSRVISTKMRAGYNSERSRWPWSAAGCVKFFVGRDRLRTRQLRPIAMVSVLVKSAFGRSLRSASPFTM
jgi:hypothetical protein